MSVPDETSYSIFIPELITSDHSRILQLLSVTCGRDDSVYSADSPTSDTTTPGYITGGPGYSAGGSGYLVLVRAGKTKYDAGDADSGVWRGKEVKIDLTGDTAIAVSHMEVIIIAIIIMHEQRWQQDIGCFYTAVALCNVM